MIYIVFIANFIITSVVEGAFIYLLFRKRNFVYYSLLCNMLTNPAMNLLLMAAVKVFGPGYYFISLLLFEIIAVLTEAYVLGMLGNMKFTKALSVSTLLNIASFLLGITMYYQSF